MKPLTFRSTESRSRHCRQLAKAAPLAKPAIEVDHLSKAMLYR
ncbi:hypothetical protein LJR175_007400 [Variovorax sp. LjRoot175]